MRELSISKFNQATKALLTIALFFSVGYTAFSQCPTIQIVDLRGTPGFPQTDDLNVCGTPDTLSLLMFTDAPGEVKGFEFTLNLVSGMRYAGFEESHYGGCTSLSNIDPDINSPSFIGGELTCGDIFVANIGVTADCSVDLELNDYLIEVEYKFTYFPPTGGYMTCSGTQTLDNDFNGAIKESVLNMFNPSPIDVTVTSLGTPACQNLTISQDGLQAYVDEFQFAVCGLDTGAGSPISISSMTANGIDILGGAIYNPADTSWIATLDATHFPGGDELSTGESVAIQVCYEVGNCPTGADIPFSYKAWYGCNDEVCQLTGQSTFMKVRPTGSLLPTISATLENGIEICGEDAKVSATVTNPNTDTDQNVYTDLHIGFQACGMEAFMITDVMVGGVSVPPVFEILGDDIDIDLSMNMDPSIGLVDYDGDGFLDDLPGGADPLDVMVTFSLACGAGDEGGCPEINCENVQFYLSGKTNCGNNFQGFPPTGGFDLQYGQESSGHLNEVGLNSTGTVVGYDFGIYSDDTNAVGQGPSEITVEFCYEFAQENIEDCPSGGDTKLVAYLAGPDLIMGDMEVVAGSVMLDDGSGYSPVDDSDAIWTLTTSGTAELEINAGNNNSTLCYKYDLRLDECHCGPARYVAVDHQIISVCSDCTPDCEIVKGCGSTLLKADPNCAPCPCMAEYIPVRTERKNLGYVDKEMSRKITRDELIAAGGAVDLSRFMPGDTLWHQGYWELKDEDLLGYADPARWMFAFRLQTPSGSATSGELQAALPLVWEAGSMILNEMRIENPDGSEHIVDISTLPACAVDPTAATPTVNSFDTHFETPWGDDPNSGYSCTATSWEGYDGNQTAFELWNFDRMEEINAETGLGVNHTRGTGDCLSEFLETYGLVEGSKIHFDFCAPMIKNPLREMAKIIGVAPAEATTARIVQQFAATPFDDIVGSNSYAFGAVESGCKEDVPVSLSCPGGIRSETNIVLDNCGGTVEHAFVVDAFAGPPGDEWFQYEYKPFIELHDLELPIYSPLAYCANARVDQNGVITPVTVDSVINMSCSPVGGYSDDLCAVDVGNEGAIVIDLYDQGFAGLGIGLDNCDTLKLSYDFCMICPAPLEGILDYELKADWCYLGGLPNECQQEAATFYNPGNSGGSNTLGDEANAAGFIGASWHNANYYNIFNLDTLFCKIDDTQGIVFIDDSEVVPMMPVTTTNQGANLIAAVSPGSSIEAQEIEFCNPDPLDATGFSGYVTVPSSVLFGGVCTNPNDPASELITTLVSDDGQTKKYKIDMPVTTLTTGQCVTAYVKTTLLFCPAPGSAPPEMCVGSSSGCSPDDVRAAIGGGGSCASSEICYAYIFGEADLQTEWFSMPDDPALCETFTLHVRTKNVKDLLLLNLDPRFTLPFGLSVVPNSWEVAYPGGAVDMTGNFGAWTGVPDPDQISGLNYSWSDDALWSSHIDEFGLVGVSSTLDSNNIAFRFQVTTNCDEFLSGSKPRTETQASDPCGPEPLSSGDVESPAIIVDGADPADFAQILAVANPSELYCGGLDNTFGITALNVSENPTTDSVVTCVLIPTDIMTYTPGSIRFPNGFVPAYVTETMIGTDLQVCVHSPALPPGQSWSLEFDAAMNEDAPCGEIEIGADIKSVVEAVSCVPGPPDECAVFVQNSLNPVILIDMQPPLATDDIRVSADCSASEDPVQVCYEIDLSNPGPQYDGNVHVGIHDDVTGNGILESFDAELNGSDHAVSLAFGESVTIEMCLDIDAIQSCPIIIKQTYETDCACDFAETPFMDLSPTWFAELPDDIVLCPSQPLELMTCGDYELTFDPAGGATMTDDGMGNVTIDINDGFGVGTPVIMSLTGMTGECEIMDSKSLHSTGDWIPEDLMANICENDCVDLDLLIPSDLVDGATITWTPELGLSDPTSDTPEVCDLTASQTYEVEISFGENCSFDIQYEVFYSGNGFTTIESEEFCLCLEAGTLTSPAGFATYEWYSIQSGAEILEAVTTTNTWNGPLVDGEYFVKATLGGALCPHVSESIMVEGKECVDLELDKAIVNIPTPLVLGSQITYELTVCNIQDDDLGLKFDATNVEISDELPGAVTYVQHTQTTGNYSPTTNQWDITLLANGTCETLSIDVTIDEPGTIENTAQISASDNDDIDSEENNDDGDQSEDDEDNAVIELACETIGGEIFYDNNEDGCQDTDEGLVMESINVSLYECGSVPGTDAPAAVTTVMDGEYEFGPESTDPSANICLLPDVQYFVVFDIPNSSNESLEDYSFTDGMADAACTAAGDSSDVDPTSGATDCVDPTGDDDDGNLDAGITPPCYEMAGEIFYDNNDDGCQDPDEGLVMEDIEVSLYECGDVPGVDQPQASTTVSDGEYEFGPDSDDPGADFCLENDTEYFVVFDIPNASGEALEDYEFSNGEASGACAVAGESDNVDPATGASGCYDPDNDDGNDGDDDQNVDAGITPPCHEISGEIFYDMNDNGCEDGSETLVMEPIGVSLYECGDMPGVDAPVANTTVTDGDYMFGEDSTDPGADVCLDPDTEYFVAFDLPNGPGEILEGYEFSSMDASAACEAGGESDDVDPTNGATGCVNPDNDDADDGDADENLDAGIIPPCHQLAGEIFYDGNGDGCQDMDEGLVMENVEVTLYECGDTPGLDTPVASTTVSDGAYEFGEDSDDPGADVCLEAGTEYFVVFNIPNASGEALDGYEFTEGMASGACSVAGESDDVDPATGQSACFDPDNSDDGDGDSDQNIDAGITPPCEQISGEIFYDTNDNGCQDAGESLVMESIGVSLFECGDDPATATPAASTTVNDGMYAFGENSDDPGADICLEPGTSYFVAFDIPNAIGESLEEHEISSATADPACEAAGESNDVDPADGTTDCVDPSNNDGGDGDDDENMDLGIVPPCEDIAGEIFFDGNDNGCQDMDEMLVDVPVEVSLYECGDIPGVDQPVASTTVTDGMYEFSDDSTDPGADICLEAGTEYFVAFDLPNGPGEALDGYEFSSENASGACAASGQSDNVDPTDGTSSCVDPNDDDTGDGDDDNNIDAGIVPPCEQLGGEIFYDGNENGCQDAGEMLVTESVSVTLYECGATPGTDAPVASTTVTDGMYTFGETSMDPGADVCLDANTEYFIVFDIPNGIGEDLEEYEFTAGMASAGCEASGESDDVDPATGESDCHNPSDSDGNGDENIDAGITPPCEQISGEIFYDQNDNGCEDIGEPLVMEAINVLLYECGDDPLADAPFASTTVTDGMYTFGENSDDVGADVCLEAGTEYFVVFDIPNGAGEALQDHEFSSGATNTTCTASGESDDVNPNTGASGCVDPNNDDSADGDSDENVDAGIVPPCYELSGEIFYDINDDGCENSGESLVMEPITVSLYECGDVPGVDPPAAVTMVLDGEYEFGELSDDPGADVCLMPTLEYFVVFDLPNGPGEALEDYEFSTGMADSACAGVGEGDDTNPIDGSTGCVDPSLDGDDENLDAGIVPPCESMGGEIFYDYDDDGCQDGDEPLVMALIGVSLYECGDTPGVDQPIASTNVRDGMYEFGEDSADRGADVCLQAGTEYFVVFDIPNAPGEMLEDHEFSSNDASGACAVGGDSDNVDPSTGASACHDPSDDDAGDGDDDNNIDAGIVPPCESLAGEIFYDDNQDGCQDSGESLVDEIVNVTLFECGDDPATAAPVASTSTNDGTYEFGEDSDDPGADVCLEPGTEYFVVFDIPNAAGEALEGYEFTDGEASPECEALGDSSDVDPATGESDCYDPNDDGADGDSDNNIDAGITPPCESIAGEIFYDENGDGCQDGSEGLVNEAIDVTLYECGDIPGVDQPAASTTVTDGMYEFGMGSDDPGADVCLEAGTEYFVVFDIPNAAGEALENFDFTEGVASGACASSGDSDNVDPTNGQSGCVDPDDNDGGDGDDDENVDAGIQPMCESLGGEIFYDYNDDGCQDGSEPLVMEAVNVSLYECGDTPGVDQPLSSITVTDGMYGFGPMSDDPGAEDCLDAGTEYFVVFDIPNAAGEALEDHEFSSNDASGACAVGGDSDNVDPSTGASACHDPSDDDAGDGDDDNNIDAGIVPPCESLGGEIFYDDNGDGCQDSDEALVDEIVNVTLFECGDDPATAAPVASTSTNDGVYEFGEGSDDPGAAVCLEPGTEYFVVFDIPNAAGEALDGYEFSDGTADAACEALGDSDDVDPATGQSDCYDPNDDDAGDGDDDNNIDAGITAPCESIAGEIFIDRNEDGCQDRDERLVRADIEVTLYECGDTPGVDQPVASTTVSDGMYEFGVDSDDAGADVCLEAGTEYFVVFDIPNGPGEALENVGFTEGIASGACASAGESDDVDPTTGASGCVDPSDNDGDDDENVDAGLVPLCESLGGEIFYDYNDDGCQDDSEPLVMEAINVSLYECGDTPGVDQPVASTSTSDGAYEFGPMSDDPGARDCLDDDIEYFVVFDLPNAAGEALEDHEFSSNDASGACAVDGDSDNVDPSTGASACHNPSDDDAGDGDDDNNIDAGIVPPCESLGGEIFYDDNQDGCQDTGESLVDEIVNVTLFECGDDPATATPVASTSTNDGTYEFGEDSDDPGADVCLDPGTEYFVVFDIPNAGGEALEGYEFTDGEASAECEALGDSSDVDPANGQSDCYDPNDDDGVDGDSDNNIDAGITPPCESIAGEIFYDDNGDGCQDGSEGLVNEAIDVTLYECGDIPGVDQPAASTTVTDGMYEFGMGSDDPGAEICLEAGTEYFVVFDIPNGPGEELENFDFTEGVASGTCASSGDSDNVDPSTGASSCVDPDDNDGGDGDDDENVDAGIQPMCESLAGEIFYDMNEDGCQDASESLVMFDVEVSVYECGDTPGVDQPLASTTVSDGEYEFGPGSDDAGADICLQAGTEYFVAFDIPNGAGEDLDGYGFTEGVASGACAVGGDSDNVDPTTGTSGCYDPDDNDGSDGDDDNDIDAGITPPCEMVAGEIFYDGNENGCQDGNEGLVMEVINVTLYECGDVPGTDAPFASTSVSDGMYEFGMGSDDPGADVCLEATTEYFVVFDIPMGPGQVLDGFEFTQGTASPGCETAGMSDDVDPSTGASDCYDPTNGDGNGDDNIDAGIKPPCEQIAGEIFYDDNNNGCQDPNEPLVDDQTIEVVLYQCGDVPGLDQPAAFTSVTDGMYLFGQASDDPGADICLEAGEEYYVQFHIPNGPGEALEDYYFSENTAAPSCLFSGEGDNIDPNTGSSGCHDPSNTDDDDGDADENIDAGIMHPCEEIAGEIFYDDNNDGCQGEGEDLVMEAVNVTLYSCNATPGVDAPVASTTTTNGEYQFGDYSVDSTDDPCLNPRLEYFVVFDFDNSAGADLDSYYFSDGDGASCAGTGDTDDTDPYTGETECYNPNNDDDDMNVDAGITPCEEISGLVFYDWNADGCQDDATEGGVEGVDVYVFECGETDTSPANAIGSTTTDANGEYTFGPEEAGTAEVCLHPEQEYFVSFDLPNAAGEALEDFHFTDGASEECAGDPTSDDVDPETGLSDCYDPSGDDSDDSDSDVDAGITPCETLGGTVFYDMDGDGCQDGADEGPVEGLEVSIYSCSETNPGPDNALATDTTNANGDYMFGPEEEDGGHLCLHPDSSYFVVFNVPNAAGEAFDDFDLTEGDGAACAGADNANDADPVTGQSDCHDPSDDDAGDGNDDESIDAGIQPCEELAGEVYFDWNQNGCQDGPNETGAEGVDVFIYECGESNPTPGNALASTTTNGDGEYTFGPGEDGDADICLQADTEYFVLFDIPNGPGEAYEGFNFTEGDSAECAGDSAADDVDPLTGMSDCYDPSGDDDDTDVDAGIEGCLDLGGTVYYDLNGDGCQDEPGEEGAEGVTAYLYNCDETDPTPGNALASDVTNTDGDYGFGPAEDGTANYCLHMDSTYYVVFDLPNAAGESLEGYNYTEGDGSACANDGAADDVNSATGTSDCYNPMDDDSGDVDAGIAIYDLALTKIIKPTDPVMVGDDICFTIEVFNQGTLPAYNVLVNDYVPSGLLLSDNDGNGWTSLSAAHAVATLAGPIMPMTSATIDVVMTVQEGATLATMMNVAEIGSFEDVHGNDVTDQDVDSTGDSDPDNDGDMADNATDGTDGDEDDSDPAWPPVFDLSLIKYTDHTGPVVPGNIITFFIEVCNQGNIAAQNVVLYDYPNTGLELSSTDANGWAIDANGQISMTYTDIIAPEKCEIVEIDMVILPGATSGNVNNFAEIGASQDVDGNNTSDSDIDSESDSDDSNDAVTMDDDHNSTNGDEDDHDPEVLDVFDLALRKLIQHPGPYSLNDIVRFDIEVCNQGDITAANVEVSDYIPAGLQFVNAPGNDAWTSVNSSLATTTYEPNILPGECVVIPLYLELIGVDPMALVNMAEISGATDDAGADMSDSDVDSFADRDNSNDIGNDPFSALNDVNNQNSYLGGDEDDHDQAWVLVCTEIVCQGNLNVSLDESCSVSVTPEMILSPALYPTDMYEITITDQYGNEVDNLFDASDIGSSFDVSISLPLCGGNSCWGSMTLEDKFPPVLNCVTGPGPNGEFEVPCNGLDQIPVPTAVENCSDYEIVLINEVEEIFECQEYTGRIVRTYVGVDAAGNQSAIPCEQVILITRPDLSQITAPPTATYSCNQEFVADANGYPAPWITPTTGSGSGVPVLCVPGLNTGIACSTASGAPADGIYLIPGPQDQICNTFVSYEDTPLETIGCTEKIMRRFEIREWWCGGEERIFVTQLIEITDDIGPTLACPADLTVSTDSGCDADVILPAITVDDQCSDISEVNVTIEGSGTLGHPDYFPGAFLQSNGGAVSLPVGQNIVTYTAYDECYNSSACTMVVTVTDNTQPVAICESNTVISLPSAGNIEVWAETFDDGSFDECGLATYEVRRMASTCDETDVTDWDDSVSFCCADVGTEVMVALRVTDISGNSNICMVTATIQDKTVPTIECPADMTITCVDVYDLGNLTATFGAPIVSDNCMAEDFVETVSDDLSSCGTGTITRDFTIADATGVIVASCQQVITIEKDEPMTEGDIVWPADEEFVDICDLSDTHPDNIGYPIILEGFCDLIGFNFEDEVFENIAGSEACAKIIRSWQVVNWCQEDANGDIQIWDYTQVIVLNNTVDPVITGTCDKIIATSGDIECDDVFVTITNTATDDCSPQSALRWTWTIDVNLDGDSSNDISGSGNDASGTYPIGEHLIRWTVEDLCGNIDFCDQQLSITNTKTPNAVCIYGLSAELVAMDIDLDGTTDTEMVTLWASDFDAESTHPCGYDVTVSFSADINDTFITFGCADVGTQTIQIWVTDSNGGTAICETFVNITNNSDEGLCDDALDGMRVVAGRISTELNDEVEDVHVNLEGSNQTDMTDNLGEYSFANMPEGGAYNVKPTKNDDLLNGVTTLDIIHIQRHILNIKELESPYQHIAADANNNGSISAVDLIEIRKAILGTKTEFTNNESWRFIDAEFAFADGINPLTQIFGEDYDIPTLSTDMYVDFTGVKIGDVNGSVTPSGFSSAANVETRSGKVLELKGDMDANQLVVRSDQSITLSGMQMTIEFNTTDANAIGIEPLGMDISSDSYHIDNDNGFITMSWNTNEPRRIETGEALFAIVLDSDVDANAIEIGSAVTKAEAYNGDFEILDINYDGGKQLAELALYQNEPNPWVSKTVVKYSLDTDQEVVFYFRDAKGSLLKKITTKGSAGLNELPVDARDLDAAAGVIFYEMQTQTDRIMKKMILVN